MKVIIFGANGLLGQWTWKAAIEAGHEVTAFVRSPEKLDSDDPKHGQLRVLAGDVMDADAVKNACEGQDVVVSCVSPAGGTPTIDIVTFIVTNAMKSGITKFYMVAGVGVLYVPGTDKTVMVMNGSPGLENASKGHVAGLAFMETTGLTQYTYICPGRMIEGPATEGRTVTMDELAPGGFKPVNLGDVAQAIVDDLNVGRFFGHRICVSQAASDQ